jgi:hypothetical protein
MPKKREDSELTKASQVELWMPNGLQEKKPKRTTIGAYTNVHATSRKT